MNPLDHRLASAFDAMTQGPLAGPRAEKARKEFQVVRQRIVDEEFKRTIDTLFAAFSRPQPERIKPAIEDALARISVLRDKGFVKTSAFLFASWCEVLGGRSLQALLPIIPNAACLEDWLKATKMPAKEAEQRLLADSSTTYATAGADWLLLRAKPKLWISLLDLFLRRQTRPSYLPAWSEALMVALKKDKRGRLFGTILTHPWPSAEHIVALAEVVRMDRSLLRMTSDLLPEILAQKNASPDVVRFVDELFAPMIMTEGADREFMSATLARLGTGILLGGCQGSQSMPAMSLVEKVARQLRNLTRKDETQAQTWVLENLRRDNRSADGRLQVTREGARYIALAIEKARQGFAAKDILSVAAHNLGLLSDGKIGERVVYNPIHHEDTQGGLIPGDQVCIEESGWVFGREILIRAKVRSSEGSRHV